MAAWEMQLVSRIIRAGDLTSVLEWGITPEDCVTSEGRAMFNHIIGYYSMTNTSGSVIGEHAARMLYPNFILCDDPSMTTDAICAETRRVRMTLDLKARLQQAQELADTDPLKAAAEAQRTSLDILALGGKNKDLRFTTAFDKIISNYKMKKEGIDLGCAQWPWPVMNEEAGSIEPADYIVFYGRPKSMKSWVLAFLISWMFNQGKRAIVYTKEMTGLNIFMRVAACIAQIRYQGLRHGDLAEHEEYSLYSAHRMVNLMKKNEQLIALEGSEEDGTDTVPWLQSKVDSYDPDIVFIDGFYLMSPIGNIKEENKRVKQISRALRQMALKTGKPVICTLQANREAAKNQDANLDEIAFSDAIGQDATQVFRVINEKDQPTIALVVGGAREFKLNGFRIMGQPAWNFDYFGPLTAKEIQKAKDDDHGEEEDAKSHVAPKSGVRPVETNGDALKRAMRNVRELT